MLCAVNAQITHRLKQNFFMSQDALFAVTSSILQQRDTQTRNKAQVYIGSLIKFIKYFIGEFSGFHGYEPEDGCLLGYLNVWLVDIERRFRLLPSSVRRNVGQYPLHYNCNIPGDSHLTTHIIATTLFICIFYFSYKLLRWFNLLDAKLNRVDLFNK